MNEMEPRSQLGSLKDLLDVCWREKKYRKTLWSIIPEVEELNNMIGLPGIKDKVVDLICYCTSGLADRSPEDNKGDYINIVLRGPPGVGKTRFADIIARMLYKMGIVPEKNIVRAKKTDFIGKYVGHSEHNTMEFLQCAKNSVLFIDEAYYGDGDQTDNFVKSFGDILNKFISENRGHMVCIIAGYEDSLERDFFSLNPGLKSRFPWIFDFKGYSQKDLFALFEKNMRDSGWSIDEEGALIYDNFQKCRFENYGRDIEVLCMKCKMRHARENFGNITKRLSASEFNFASQEFKKEQTLTYFM